MGSEDEGEAEKRPAASKNPPAAASKKRKAESSSEDSSSDSEAAAPAAKKGKFVTSTPAPPKATATPSPQESESAELDSGIEDDKSKFAQGKKTTNAPYRRIQNYGEIEVKTKLNDNSFESKAGFD